MYHDIGKRERSWEDVTYLLLVRALTTPPPIFQIYAMISSCHSIGFRVYTRMSERPATLRSRRVFHGPGGIPEAEHRTKERRRHAAVYLVAEAASQAHAADVEAAARLELLQESDGRQGT